MKLTDTHSDLVSFISYW